MSIFQVPYYGEINPDNLAEKRAKCPVCGYDETISIREYPSIAVIKCPECGMEYAVKIPKKEMIE